MRVLDEIRQARATGTLRCDLVAVPELSLPELVRAAGLRNDLGGLRELDAASARNLIAFVLHRDLAYEQPILSSAAANALADAFAALFDAEAPKYFSNRDACVTSLRSGGQLSLDGGWYPMTDATFDTGVLVLGRLHSGFLWVEDED